MRKINFNRNHFKQIDDGIIKGLEKLRGKLWEFILPDIDSSWRVFKSFYNGFYYIYEKDYLVSIIGCSGEIIEYRGTKPLVKRTGCVIEYENIIDGVVSISGGGNKLYLNDNLVAKLGGEDRFTWLLKCIVNLKLLPFKRWHGIEFDEQKIDIGLALTLKVTSLATLD